MIEIFLLEQLVSFAKNGTLSRAAEELHISQPALSRSMKKLEDMFEIPLFDRAKSKITLNETGKVAAEYAQRALDANREMIERTIAFDRSRRTIVFGSCASLPINELMPIFQEHFSGMAITSEIASNDKLISGLKNHVYQLAVLHELPDDDDIFCQRYIDEQLYIMLPSDHFLASKKAVSFADLNGMSILAHGNALFWINICKQNLKESKLLIQNNMDALSELVDASPLPVFNSNLAMKRGREPAGRVTIPIEDKAAYATYYLSCLNSEKIKYNSVFNAVRSAVIRGNNQQMPNRPSPYT